MAIRYKHGEITKLPKDLDPNELIYKKEFNEYSTCPFCKTDMLPACFVGTGFKRLNGAWWTFWIPLNWCKKINFKCKNCGAEWESPWFPQDIKLEEFPYKGNTDVDWLIKKYGVELDE